MQDGKRLTSSRGGFHFPVSKLQANKCAPLGRKSGRHEMSQIFSDPTVEQSGSKPLSGIIASHFASKTSSNNYITTILLICESTRYTPTHCGNFSRVHFPSSVAHSVTSDSPACFPSNLYPDRQVAVQTTLNIHKIIKLSNEVFIYGYEHSKTKHSKHCFNKLIV